MHLKKKQQINFTTYSNKPILQNNIKMSVNCNANHLNCSALVSQDQDGCGLLISFISLSFKKKRLTNKVIIENELQAILFALKPFRYYLMDKLCSIHQQQIIDLPFKFKSVIQTHKNLNG